MTIVAGMLLQIADEWAAAPVIGRLSAETVLGIVACAQQTAQQAVSSQQSQQRSSNSASAPTSPEQAAVSAAAGPQLISEGNSSGGLSANITAAWAAISGSLLRRIPCDLSSVLQRAQAWRAVRHLDVSLASGDQVRPVRQNREPASGQLVDEPLYDLSTSPWTFAFKRVCAIMQAACAIQRRRLRDLLAYKLPGQTNR